MITKDDLKSLSCEDLEGINYEELEDLELISKKYKKDGFRNLSFEELRDIELKLWDISWHTKSWIVRKIVVKVLDDVTNIIEEYERDKERLNI